MLGTMGQNQRTGGISMNIGLLGFGVVGGGVLEALLHFGCLPNK